MSCGAALGGSLREERKLVSVVFVDIVGFTSRAEQLDVEDLRATLRPFFSMVRGELERYGGRVEKYIGDAVVAVYGAPAAHEDDAERAVRAALAIRDAIAGLNERESLDLHVRVGVNTGEALVALDQPDPGEGMVTGDMVNVASRLQTGAPVDGVLVGEATQRATAGAIQYGPPLDIAAKGKAPTRPSARGRGGASPRMRGREDRSSAGHTSATSSSSATRRASRRNRRRWSFSAAARGSARAAWCRSCSR
jgi:class 3 adenylate cyclase